MIKPKYSSKNLMLKWGAVLVFLGIISYPIIIFPSQNPDYYKEIQKESRSNIEQQKIQPGNMKVWSDPFDRKK